MGIPNRAGLSAYALTDEQYEDFTITEVKESGEWFDLRFDSMGFGLAKSYDGHPPHGIVPKAGDTIREYGQGLGYQVRGVAINGVVVYWHSPDELKELNRIASEKADADRRRKFEENKPKLDAQYDALPEIFRQRIDRFRANNPDFRWEFEGYELFCCTEAMKFANYFKTFEEFQKYASLKWEEQAPIDKAAGISDDHSGNTHGMAVALAGYYLKQPEAVAKLHGALSPLVGSWAYGDMAPDALGGEPE